MSVTEPEPSVLVRDLYHYFTLAGGERTKVLDGNNLTLRPGEIVIIVGRAGAGKTTLLTLIGALRRMQEGELAILGEDLRRARLVDVRRRIGFIFQRHNLFDSLTARQNVALALASADGAAVRDTFEQLRRWDREFAGFFQNRLADMESGAGAPGGKLRGKRAEAKRAGLRAFVNDRAKITALLDSGACDHDLARALLSLLGLDERTGHKPQALSGGQRQRVAIARALVNRPELILADEPTASLDEENGRVVAMLLQKHAKENGCTIILVTHDPQILDIADRIVTMEKGRIISDNDLKQLTQVCEFLKHCPSFAGMTPEELREVADKLSRESHPAGTRVIRQGDVGDKFYLIKSGQVDVFIDGETPAHHVRTLGAGDFFGELALLEAESGVRTASVRARGDVELYALSKDDFREALAESPSFEKQVRLVYQSIRLS